jgi:hypothetical protein
MTLEKLLTPYYCQQALQLCQQARILRNEHHYQEAAELCSIVSTLCVKNGQAFCEHESKLCASSVKDLNGGNYSQSEKVCMEARRICPMNHTLVGS